MVSPSRSLCYFSLFYLNPKPGPIVLGRLISGGEVGGIGSDRNIYVCSLPIQIPHHIPFKSNITKFSPLPSLSLFLPLKSLFSRFYVPLNFPDCRNPSLYSAYLPAYPSPFLMGLFLFSFWFPIFKFSLF